MARAGEGAAACGILRKNGCAGLRRFLFFGAHARQGNPAEALRDVSLSSYSLA
jgi:hypothetical protein